MSNRRIQRTLTPAQAAEKLEGSRRLMPGVWLDREGYVHFSMPEILKELGLPDTPESRAFVNEQLSEMLGALSPDAVIVETELEN